jgi:hypothetical protein
LVGWSNKCLQQRVQDSYNICKHLRANNHIYRLRLLRERT